MRRPTSIDWRAAATQLAMAVPRTRLHPEVLAWSLTAEARQTWAVAFSGGADSLALLLLLWAHWPGQRRRLVAIHFNHRLRGATADRDERFCQVVAESLGIRWRRGRWSESVRGASEAQARTARHAYFSHELRRLRTNALWLGHQQDDVVETMLMRLARGSGTAGMAAPRPIQRMVDGRVHLRPLLGLKKIEIVEHLMSQKIPWREDASNRAGKFLRNRLRQDVVPAWRLANADRDALAGAALSRELLEEDDNALEVWLSEIRPLTAAGGLNLRRLVGRPRGLVRRALHLWLGAQATGVGLSRQAFTAILDDVIKGRVTRHSLGRGGFVKIGRYQLMFEVARGKLSN